jgi:hypothetical protein
MGKVKQLIHITTDLGEKSRATFTAYATVLPDDPARTATEPGAAAGPAGGGTASDAGDPSNQVASQ